MMLRLPPFTPRRALLTTVTLALAAGLTACTSTVTSTVFNTVTVSGSPQPVTAATTVAQLTGAGSTFDAPFFDLAFPAYEQANIYVGINYDAVGSSAGITQYVAGNVNFGASVRAAQFVVLAAKSRALLRGRYHVAYEDIRTLAAPILRHRILLNFHAESERLDSDAILKRLLEWKPEPK